jgi:chemotaxis protein CheD
VPIGKRNIEFVKSYISKECLSIASEDVGGNYPRRIHYYPISGKVMVRILTKNPQEIFSKEKNYYQNVSTKPVEGDVELF